LKHFGQQRIHVLQRSVEMLRKLLLLSLVLVSFRLAGSVNDLLAQEIGDAEKGRAFAIEVCSGCHAVLPEQPVSPVAEAPRFEDVANTSGMTAIALTAWFQTSHPTMPNIRLTDEETRNVIQYILNLKSE
jgi:mono/diheme cytochrome c family protein